MKRWTLVTTATLLAAILSAPGFAANSKCANPVGSVEQRACAMAASGPDALRHFIELRGSEHADVEIRKVAVAMLKLLQRESPSLFADYELKPLADGSHATHTEHPKV